MTIRFVDEAQSEFLDAISAYEDARGGLGQRFKDEVDRCVLWIADHPELIRPRAGSYRRINPSGVSLLHPLHRQRTDYLGLGCRSWQPKTALLDFPTQ